MKNLQKGLIIPAYHKMVLLIRKLLRIKKAYTLTQTGAVTASITLPTYYSSVSDFDTSRLLFRGQKNSKKNRNYQYSIII